MIHERQHGLVASQRMRDLPRGAEFRRRMRPGDGVLVKVGETQAEDYRGRRVTVPEHEDVLRVGGELSDASRLAEVRQRCMEAIRHGANHTFVDPGLLLRLLRGEAA